MLFGCTTVPFGPLGPSRRWFHSPHLEGPVVLPALGYACLSAEGPVGLPSATL